MNECNKVFHETKELPTRGILHRHVRIIQSLAAMFARILVSLSLLCVSGLPVLAKNGPAESGEISVYLKGDFGTSPPLRTAFTAEVNRLMASLGYRVNWPYHAMNVPGTLVVVTAEGSCTTGGDASAELDNKPLASTQDANGHVLPFVWVKCAELNGLLAPGLRKDPPAQEARYGRALARVLAHELFHILAQTTHHAESGIAQTAVNEHNLLGLSFEFDEESRAILRGNRRVASNPPSASITGF